eukprot:CAMPEP_0113675656 /NCGR_PEP_ID=MMETSP0038_2-20120614/8149_1 /TAXON_ID=2898 /ORGANISM="Cryptomonas paramecium" /LENGTH=553 /DNA_ID=CAMNT_0000592479 /DNA_START=137 /DNA_END=1795 /DNA_ORIENTATION=+ /assembly_acc=CAM_ASM_000170
MQAAWAADEGMEVDNDSGDMKPDEAPMAAGPEAGNSLPDFGSGIDRGAIDGNADSSNAGLSLPGGITDAPDEIPLSGNRSNRIHPMPHSTTTERDFVDIPSVPEPPQENSMDFDPKSYLQRQRARVYRIQELKDKIESRTIPSLSSVIDNEPEVGEAAMTVAHVSVETLERQQRQIEREQERAMEEERQKQEIRKRIIREKEEEAKKRMKQEKEKSLESIRKHEELRIMHDRARARGMRDALREATSQMEKELEQRGAKLRHYYSKVEDNPRRAHLLDSKWSLSAAFNSAPQPLQLRPDCLRAVGEKLPKGHYKIQATLLDRLGGDPLFWTGAAEERQHRMSACGPFRHKGRYLDVDLICGEPMHLLCPPANGIRPGLCCLFEVYEMQSRHGCEVDRVVAWGVLPLVTPRPTPAPHFPLVRGRLVVPLLRGECDRRLILYQTLENIYEDDLDNWLCNLYVTVRVLPRRLPHMDEITAHLTYTSKLLGVEPPEYLRPKSTFKKPEIWQDSDSEEDEEEAEREEGKPTPYARLPTAEGKGAKGKDGKGSKRGSAE